MPFPNLFKLLFKGKPTGNKQLYESCQIMQSRIDFLEEQLRDNCGEGSSINPIIQNSMAYNRVLCIMDEIQACTRYNMSIPELELPSNRIEALFYNYGSLCFYRNDKDELKVASYAKSGDLNGLGDLTVVIPIDFAGKTQKEHRTVVYDTNTVSNPCVIINDYTGTYKEDKIYPRVAINRVSINDEAEVYRQMKNAVKLTAKKAIASISDPNQREAVEATLRKFFNNSDPIASVVDGLQNTFKVFNLETSLDLSGYLKAIITYEDLRANFNGIITKNPLDKKEREITAEREAANALTEFYAYDGLINRQVGCELMVSHGITKEASCTMNDISAVSKEDKKEGKENASN